MSVSEYEATPIEMNEEGFLIDSSQWTPDVAERIASEAGVGPLGDQHWRVITFCREDAAQQGQSPGLRRISKQSGVAMEELDIPSVREMLEILHDSGARIYACRMAMEMFKLERKDLVPQVDEVISAMDYYDKSAGAQLLFV